MAQRLVSSKRPTRYASDAWHQLKGSRVTRRGREERCNAEVPAPSKSTQLILNQVKIFSFCIFFTERIRTHLLKSHDSRALEAEVSLEVLRNLAHQALERELADQELGGLSVLADLTESHGTGAVAMRLLDATSGRRRFARRLNNTCIAHKKGGKKYARTFYHQNHVRLGMG